MKTFLLFVGGVTLCISTFVMIFNSSIIGEYDILLQERMLAAFFIGAFIVAAVLIYERMVLKYEQRQVNSVNRTTQYLIYNVLLRELKYGMNESTYASTSNEFVAICSDKNVAPPVGYNIVYTFLTVDDLKQHILNSWLIQDNSGRMCVIEGMNTSPSYQLIADDGEVVIHQDPDYTGYDVCNDEPDWDIIAWEREQAEFEGDHFEGYGNHRV